MDLMHIMLVIIVFGVLLYCANAFIPMQATVKKILNIVVVVILVYWLLHVLGIWESLRHFKI